MNVAASNNPFTRLESTSVHRPNPFRIDAASRTYKHQYSNIYFVRLHHLRQAVQTVAELKWKDWEGQPVLVPRLLDVVKGRVCYIVGTVYLDMPLKPNVMEDLGRDRSIPAPPEKDKFYSERDGILLEDESGRIRLTGDRLTSELLVTGVIMAALGMETPTGDFEVLDVCFAGLPPNESHATSHRRDEWVALVSGLDIGSGVISEGLLQLLVEYLSGEAGGDDELALASMISRVIFVGNSLGLSGAAGSLEGITDPTEKKPRRYANENGAFSKQPIETLSEHLLDVARCMPVHMVPGCSDPCGTILPQQAMPRAMFGSVSSLAGFQCETNPALVRIGDDLESDPSSASEDPHRLILATSGQTMDDMFKYVRTPPVTRLALAEATLRWRHIAPTAPDTLWCHPYFTSDPFILANTPDFYVIGNQPHFQTKLIEDEEHSRRCRIILLPSFARTGMIVLANLSSSKVRLVQVGSKGMDGEEKGVQPMVM